jgi:hypothetical protein
LAEQVGFAGVSGEVCGFGESFEIRFDAVGTGELAVEIEGFEEMVLGLGVAAGGEVGAGGEAVARSVRSSSSARRARKAAASARRMRVSFLPRSPGLLPARVAA